MGSCRAPCSLLGLFFPPGHNYPVSGALGWRFFGTQLGAVRINPGWVGSFQIFRFSVFSFVWSIACARVVVRPTSWATAPFVGISCYLFEMLVRKKFKILQYG